MAAEARLGRGDGRLRRDRADGESTLFCDLPTADVAVVFDGEGALLAPASELDFEPVEAIDATRSYATVSDAGRRPPRRATSTPAATGSPSRSRPS